MVLILEGEGGLPGKLRQDLHDLQHDDHSHMKSAWRQFG